jgi:DNA polymerase III delta prime subunit
MKDGSETKNNQDNDEMDEAPAEESKVSLLGMKKGKPKGSKIKPIKRPIILIANDAYTPALKQIRELSLVVKIHESDNAKLMKRMRQIVKTEKVRVEDRVLRELAESTCYDARSCINMLQFFSSMQQEEFITHE